MCVCARPRPPTQVSWSLVLIAILETIREVTACEQETIREVLSCNPKVRRAIVKS